MSEIEAFTIAATDEQLADLKQRLANTRWPDAELVLVHLGKTDISVAPVLQARLEHMLRALS